MEHRLLTSPTAVLDVDFLKDGAAIMMPSWSPPRAPSPGLCLPIRRTGHADAVAVWFDLWLDNEREECDVVSTRSERCRRVDDASGWVSMSILCVINFHHSQFPYSINDIYRADGHDSKYCSRSLSAASHLFI